MSTSRLRTSVMPIRFDYSPRHYECGVHPAAHIHIGLGNEMRLCARRLMNPVSFALFVVRQMYPESWRELLVQEDVEQTCRAVRDNLSEVEARFFQGADRFQLILE